MAKMITHKIKEFKNNFDLLSEHSDKRFYTKLFIIRIFFERYCLYGIFLKKDADKNISIYDNRGTNHKEVPLWTHINP